MIYFKSAVDWYINGLISPKNFFTTAHARWGLKSSLGTSYTKSVGSMLFSILKLPKISRETKINSISHLDQSVSPTKVVTRRHSVKKAAFKNFIPQLYLKRDPNTSVFCEFYVIFKSSCSYRTSPVAASVYFLLDGLYLSLQPIHVINYLFNNVIWICYSVFFYSIAFIANTFHLGFHLVWEFLFFLYFFGCCEC